MRGAFIFVALAAASVAACGSRSALKGADGAAGTHVAGSGGGAGTTGAAGDDAAGTSGAAGVSGLDAAAGATDGPVDRLRDGATLPDGRCATGAYMRDGACMCDPPFTSICEDRCVDLQNDDDHCGRCGSACGSTSVCVRGVCGPPPVEILAAHPGCGSLDLSFSADTLYFADAFRGRIGRTYPGLYSPSSSGTIAGEELRPSNVVARGTSVFWIGGGKKEVRRGAFGEPSLTVATSDTDIHGLAVTYDATTVYFSTSSSVMRVSASGGLPVEVAHDELGGVPMALALEGDQLAFTNDLTEMVSLVTLVEGQLATCNGFDGVGGVFVNCERVAHGQGSLLLDRIGMSPTHVVWVNSPQLLAGVRAAPSTSPGALSQVASTDLGMTGFVVTPNLVAFSTSDLFLPHAGTGTVGQAPLEHNGPQVRLARGLQDPRALATDGVRVFWATSDCSIQATPLVLP